MDSWPADPCVQSAQKCPLCGLYLLIGQDVQAFGDWSLHAACLAAAAPLPHRCDPPRGSASELWDFCAPGVCCVCATVAYLNTAHGCERCYRAFFDAKSVHING